MRKLERFKAGFLLLSATAGCTGRSDLDVPLERFPVDVEQYATRPAPDFDIEPRLPLVSPVERPPVQRYVCPPELYPAIYEAASKTEAFRLNDGKCLSRAVLADLRIRKVDFDVKLSSLDEKCHASVKIDARGEPVEVAGAVDTPSSFESDIESVEVISLLGYPDMLDPPFNLPRFPAEVEAAYRDSPYKSAINIVIEEKPYWETGILPGRFHLMGKAKHYRKVKQRQLADDFKVPYKPKGQLDEDPLVYYISAKYPERGVNDGYDFYNNRYVRIMPYWDIRRVSSFSLVGAVRSENWGEHDALSKAEQVMPDGTIFVEHGIPPDQLFRMTEIFDKTEDYITQQSGPCEGEREAP